MTILRVGLSVECGKGIFLCWWSFLTINDKKGERKGRALRAIVGNESGQNDPQTGPERAWTGRSPVLMPAEATRHLRTFYNKAN